MENIGYYIFILVAIIVAFLIIKKVTTCLIKSIVLIVLAAVLGYIYWMYLRYLSLQQRYGRRPHAASLCLR